MRHHHFQNSEDSGDNPAESSEGNVQVFLEGKTDEDRYLEKIQASVNAHTVNQNTLSMSIHVLEKSVFWMFKSPQKKLRLIQEMYTELAELV